MAGGVASCGVFGFVSNSLGSDDSSDLMSKLLTIPAGFLWHSVQWRRNLETASLGMNAYWSATWKDWNRQMQRQMWDLTAL